MKEWKSFKNKCHINTGNPLWCFINVYFLSLQQVCRMFLVCLLFWRMIFCLFFFVCSCWRRRRVLHSLEEPPGGATEPPGSVHCSTCCMFLSVFTLYRSSTDSTKQNIKPRSETGREAKLEGLKEKVQSSQFSPETRSCSRRAVMVGSESWTCRFWRSFQMFASW